MGQKINANIFRLGHNNFEWQTKYVTSTTEESSLLLYKDLEVKTYIKQCLSNYGLILHNYKNHFNENSMYISISYLITNSSIVLINKKNLDEKIKLKKNQITINSSYYKKDLKVLKRLHLLRKYKTYEKQKFFENKDKKFKNNFTQQLLEGLNLFYKNQINIFINMQCLNTGLSLKLKKKEQTDWRKKMLLLKRYSKLPVFDETVNVLITASKFSKSAQLVADFVAKKLPTFKRQSYFLIFLKQVLKLTVYSSTSNIQGIKMIIKGRFNGAPRARKNTLLVGKVPIQTLSQKINNYQSTAFSSNGTFGVTVWICEKIY